MGNTRKTAPPDAEALVAQHFPLYGPYSEEHTFAAGTMLTEMMRYLNYATGQGARDALPYASTTGDVVGSIKAAVGMLDQALDQMARRAKTFEADPNLYDATARSDEHTSAVARAQAAQRGLEQIRTLLGVPSVDHRTGRITQPNGVYKALETVHSDLMSLGHREGLPDGV
jgi:hypothetical protein